MSGLDCSDIPAGPLGERATLSPSDAVIARSLINRYVLRECFVLTDGLARAVERSWGIPASVQAEHCYGAVPDSIAKTVVEHEISGRRASAWLLGVPGFYKEGELLRVDARPGALLIPVRGPKARVLGIQYCQRIQAGQLYWLTSRGKPKGSAATAYPHVAQHQRIIESGVALLTDHTLWADALAYRFGAGAVGLNRCKSDALISTLRELSVKRIVTMFDPEVQATWANDAAIRAIRRVGIPVEDAE